MSRTIAIAPAPSPHLCSITLRGRVGHRPCHTSRHLVSLEVSRTRTVAQLQPFVKQTAQD
eukprot:13464889-Alexandrium_andersonii.AAC.1